MPSQPIRLTWGETRRKLAHMAAFWPALFLPWLTPLQSLGATFLLLLMNVFILPKLAHGLYRAEESGQGALEIILYPAALMACVIAFGSAGASDVPHMLPRVTDAIPGGGAAVLGHALPASGAGKPAWYLPVAAAWFALAFVDAGIGMACRLLPNGAALPWNPRKPALAVGLGAAAAFIPAWLLIHAASALAAAPMLAARLPPAFASGMAAAPWPSIALLIFISAAAETAWFGVADNLVIPFFPCALAPLIPNCAWVTQELLGPNAYWAPAAAAFGVAAYATGLLTLGGSFLGAILSLILILANPWLFAFLGGFFVLGNLATRFGASRKRALGIAEARGGKRGAAEVFGAMGMAVWMTPLVHLANNATAPGPALHATLLVCIAPLIAKTMDTVSSETGKALKGKTISLRTFKSVPPGSEGGVSMAGTLLGLAGAVILALAILPLGWGGFRDALGLSLIALLANAFESYWGEWAARKGMDPGAHTNVLMTLAAAVLGWLLWIGRY